MFLIHRSRALKLLLTGVVLVSLYAASAFGAAAQGAPGAVFTMTNAEEGNAVIVWQRGADGSLEMAGEYATDGDGSGGGLGSQGALFLSNSGDWLFAVNAGSDEISAFRVDPDGLSLTSTVSSGGEMPISIAVHGRWVYALNAGGAGNIAGFILNNAGELVPLDGATRGLSQSGGTGPAQVQFTPDGSQLVVTEKATNRIVVYPVGTDGIAGHATVNPSHGMTPFGFDFGQNGTLVVSEAFGGAEDASAVSTYDINHDGSLRLISGTVHSTETAACWVAVTPDGRHAYTTNTGSGSVSAFGIRYDGRAFLIDATLEHRPEDGKAGLTGDGSSPIDASVSQDGQFLYVLNGSADSISIFAVDGRGNLTDAGTVTGLASSTVGIVAG